MITAHEVETAGFRRAARGSVGYDEDAVDDFLDRVVETLSAIERGGEQPAQMLSARDVVDVIFIERGPSSSGGYDLDDVDDLLDRVAQRIHRYEEGLRHAVDPAAGKAPIQHQAVDDGANDGSTAPAAHDGSRGVAQDDAHVVTPLEQVHEGRGEAENPAVADLDRQDGRSDAGTGTGPGSGAVAGAAASAGAVTAAAVEQKRAPAARDHHDEHDLHQVDAAGAQPRGEGRGDRTEVIDVAHVSSAREDDAVRVAPARDERDLHAQPVGAEHQPEADTDSAVQENTSAQQNIAIPGQSLAPEQTLVRETTPLQETASTSSDEPLDDSLEGINMVGGRPLDEVRTDMHDRPSDSAGPTRTSQAPAPAADGVSPVGAAETAARADAVSPEARFDAERRDDQAAAPASETSSTSAPAVGAPAVGAEPSRATTNLSKSTEADAEQDDRQVNDQEERVVVKESGGASSVTPLMADDADELDDEHGEQFESFESASAGAVAEPGVREPADTPDGTHDDAGASAEAPVDAPRADERSTSQSGRQGLTVQPTKARLATDPGVTGEQSRRLDAAWRAAVPQTDEEKGEKKGEEKGEEKGDIISYPATDHRVPLPRGEARREVSAQDREAESQFHPEYSAYASQDAPVAPESQSAPEPQETSGQQATPAQQGADDERGHVRVIGRTGYAVAGHGESGSASDAVPDDRAPQADHDVQHDDAAESEARRVEIVENVSRRPVEPEVPLGRPADEHDAAEEVRANDGAAVSADTHGDDEVLDIENHDVENHGTVPARQDDDFDPFAARSAVADEPLTSTVETPSAMRSASTGEASAPVEPVAPAAPAQPVHHTSAEAPIVKEPAPMTTENGHELQHARLDDDRAEPTPRAEPIERPESIDTPQGIETARELPARDDTSRKGLLRRIFKG